MTEKTELSNILWAFFSLSVDDQAFVKAQLNEASSRVLDEFARKSRGFSPQLESLIQRAGDGLPVGEIRTKALSALRDAAAQRIPLSQPDARSSSSGIETFVSAMRRIR